MSRSDDENEQIHQHSGWLIPLSVFLVTLALSALFLLYYLAPTLPPLFAEQASPTSSTEPVALRIGNLRLWIPANYIEFESARKGGARREVALFAMLPDLTGWSNWDAASFTDNGATSRIVHLTLKQDDASLGEAEKLQRIYLAYVVDPRGKIGPYGLTQYRFRSDTGYHNEDLFVGETDRGPVVLHCARLGKDVLSPGCLRDMKLAPGVTLSYRFKRSKLVHWREIAGAVDKIMTEFRKPPK